MKILLDTNVLIPLEPTLSSETESLTGPASRLIGICRELGFEVFLHPATRIDLANDQDRRRMEIRRLLLSKYQELPDPPRLQPRLRELERKVVESTNEAVDLALLASIEGSAADLLISEDRGLRSKARRLSLGERVLTVEEALRSFRAFARSPAVPPPAVQRTVAHSISWDDPILESFREEYPGFDEWFDRCRRQHRLTWLVEGSQGRCAAFCIVKQETEAVFGLSGSLLKICSFKVQGQHAGNRFGELLLKAVFEHAIAEHVDWIYLTAFQRHDALIELMEDFGFARLEERSALGEVILAKPMPWTKAARAGEDPVAEHVRFGPMYLPNDTPWYLVPIQPKFSNVLFPESADVKSLFPGRFAFGNALRKAYLCNSPQRKLEPGSVLVFYRSQTNQAVIALGVVEVSIRSSNAAEITRAVTKRSVYSLEEIRTMCSRSTLAILFRQASSPNLPISAAELSAEGVIRYAPQSITQIRGEARLWLETRLRR